MSEFDPSDLMAVCEAILEDGELSGREVYRLCQWLNDNREATQHWPGNLLVQPLQRAWADGELTTDELQEVGRLLLRIHADWSERYHETNEPVPEFAPDLFKSIDLRLPRLLLLPWVTRVCTDAAGTCVHVDLNGPSCTCPEWQTNRSSLPAGHLSRCCRHVLSAYGRVKPTAGWPGWMRAFLAYRWTPHPLKNWIIVDVDGVPVLASTAPVDWADVFAPDGGEYERFGYHIREDRWAYGSLPAGGDLIRRRIVAATRAGSADASAVRRVRIRLPAALRGGNT
jgi:hypothetical protein